MSDYIEAWPSCRRVLGHVGAAMRGCYTDLCEEDVELVAPGAGAEGLVRAREDGLEGARVLARRGREEVVHEALHANDYTTITQR